MNSIEKYEEIVHEYGSWEKYMDSLKPTQNVQNRIQIDGVWYVREDAQLEESFEDINLTKCLTCLYETQDYCWVASRMYKDDGETFYHDGETFYPGVDIKFTDKTSGDRETWVEDYWDNDTWLLGVYNNNPDSIPDAKQVMNEKGIKDFRNFIHKLIQMGWLEK